MEYPRAPLRRPELLERIRVDREARRSAERDVAKSGRSAPRDRDPGPPVETARNADYRTKG